MHSLHTIVIKFSKEIHTTVENFLSAISFNVRKCTQIILYSPEYDLYNLYTRSIMEKFR